MDQRLLELGRSQFVELLDLCRRRRDEIGAWYRQEIIGARDDSRTGEEYVAVFAGLGLGELAHVVDGLGTEGMLRLDHDTDLVVRPCHRFESVDLAYGRRVRVEPFDRVGLNDQPSLEYHPGGEHHCGHEDERQGSPR